MPPNDGRQHNVTKRTLLTTFGACAAAVLALALAACTASTTTSASGRAATSSPVMTLTAAGSTFDAPFFGELYPFLAMQADQAFVPS